jgi:hypothetical protein
MLIIENINKIIGRQIDRKWEIDSVTTRENGNEYMFRLVNIGIYKHYQWAIALDRTLWPGAWGEGYRMYCFDHNKTYETFILPNEIHSIDFVLSEMALLIEKSKQ